MDKEGLEWIGEAEKGRYGGDWAWESVDFEDG